MCHRIASNASTVLPRARDASSIPIGIRFVSADRNPVVVRMQMHNVLCHLWKFGLRNCGSTKPLRGPSIATVKGVCLSGALKMLTSSQKDRDQVGFIPPSSCCCQIEDHAVDTKAKIRHVTNYVHQLELADGNFRPSRTADDEFEGCRKIICPTTTIY
jgi:hypothetical protein